MTHPAVLHRAPLDATLAEVRTLYAEGRYIDAWAAGQTLGDLREWPSIEGRLLAARLAARLGAAGLFQALAFHAHRASPEHAEAAFYYASLLRARRGPWHALEFVRQVRERHGANSADLMGLEASALGALRDFDRAHARFDEAIAVAEDTAWLRLERSVVLAAEDRVDDALTEVEALLADRPEYRFAIRRRAQLLAKLGRSTEGYAALRACDLDQGFELLLVRSEVARDLGEYEASDADLARAQRAAIMAEPALIRELASQRAEVLYFLRRHREAESFARASEQPFDARFAERLACIEDGAALPRVRCAVPPIQQRHGTCAPAALASILAYYGDAVDQDEIAAAICYDGTPVHRERTWAEARGYTVRELDLTFASLRTLIDASFPFVLTTCQGTSSHAQVVAGYDLARSSLSIADPTNAQQVEISAAWLFETQAFHGPHAMVIAPPERAAALRGLSLPSTDLADVRHALALALSRHDLDVARAAVAQLEALAPGSRHAWDAKWVLASYEGRVDVELACLDALLALHPSTSAWIARRLDLLRDRARGPEWRAFLDAHRDHDDPVLVEAIAEALIEDGQRASAERSLRRVLRLAPDLGAAHRRLADLRSIRGADPACVLEGYRLASRLAPADEHAARAYYDHARLRGEGAEALAWLERRVHDASDRASDPASTLYEIYRDRGELERGRTVLESLAASRVDDGNLRVTLAHAALDAGHLDVAARWLDEASTLPAREGERVAARVRLLRSEGRPVEALRLLEHMHQEDPLAWASDLADLRAELAGPAEAIEVIEAAREKQPQDPRWLEALISFHAQVDDARAEVLLDEHLAREPEDPFALCERAQVLARLERVDESMAAARRAVSVLPEDPRAAMILGGLLAGEGVIDEARAHLRRAVMLDVDNAVAIHLLANLDEPNGHDNVRFVIDALSERTSRGPGLLEGARAALHLPGGEAADRLERLLDVGGDRPDSWEIFTEELLLRGELDTARRILPRAVARFPEWAPLGKLEADRRCACGDLDGAERLLRELLLRQPYWLEARLALVSMLEERSNFDGAIEVAEDGLRHTPSEAELRFAWARLSYENAPRRREVRREDAPTMRRKKRGSSARDVAFDAMLALVREVFTHERGYLALEVWARELGREHEVEALVRAHIEAHEARPLGYVRLATWLSDPEDLGERITALERALESDPRSWIALDLLAELLVGEGCVEEALALCSAEVWGAALPIPLRGRRAWVLAMADEIDQAIEEMTAVLGADPTYVWGRRMLCDWLEAERRMNDFADHAEQLVAYAPACGEHHAYLGDARRHLGDHRGAREAFVNALELAPSDVYAAMRLVELEVAARDLKSARRLLVRLRETLAPAEIEALRVRVELGARRRRHALEAFERMLASSLMPALIEDTLAVLVDAGLATEAKACVSRRRARSSRRDGDDARVFAGAMGAVRGR